MLFLQKMLLAIYSFFKRKGWLDNYFFEKIFIASYFFYKKYFEDRFDTLIKNYPQLFKGGHILDIGANIGYTSTLFAKAVMPGFKVYAFEPDLSNFRILNQVIQAQKTTEQIISIHAAVGEKNGTVELWRNEKHHGDHRVVTQGLRKAGLDLKTISAVEMWCIDSFVKAEKLGSVVKFVKIDVQGYELSVCLGMKQTLVENPDAVIALEYAPRGMSELGFEPKELLNFFQHENYFIYVVNRKGQLELAQNEVIDKLVQQRGYIDILCSKRNLFS